MGCDCCAGGCSAKKGGRTIRARRAAGEAEGSATIVALLGQPNSGKPTLFNGLTGAHQHVGNWPGKTVEVKEGPFSHNGVAYELIDLPGSYSITAQSPEEEVTRDYLGTGEADVVVAMADALQLERSLYMLADFTPQRTPRVLAVNLMDVAARQGKKVDTELLERRLGIPVVPMVASRRKGFGALVDAVDRAARDCSVVAEPPVLPDAAAMTAPECIQAQAAARYAWIEGVLDGVVEGPAAPHALSRLDRIAIGSRFSTTLAFATQLGVVLAENGTLRLSLAGATRWGCRRWALYLR